MVDNPKCLFPKREVCLSTKIIPIVLSFGRGAISSCFDPFYLKKLNQDINHGKDNVIELLCDTAGLVGYASGFGTIIYSITQLLG